MKRDIDVNLVNRGNGEVGLEIGEATLVIKAEVAVRILLEKLLHPQPSAARSGGLPAIGAQWEGGIYAGLSVADEKPVALVLLPGEESLPWEKAVDWAKKQDGTLPSRFDQLVLFKNLKGAFKDAWYWSGEQYAGYDAYAWCQYFGNGDQSHYHKDFAARARAVRRVTIQ